LRRTGRLDGRVGTCWPCWRDAGRITVIVTYARRYTQPGITNTASEEDDDGNAASVPPARPASPNPPVKAASPTQSKAYSEEELAEITKKANGSVDKVSLDDYWKSLAIPKTHPQYAAILSIFTAASSKFNPPQKQAA
jgi:hypothetical protein